MPPSTLSLHGLVRHLAGVERWWFQQNFERRDVPFLFFTEDEPDLDFDPPSGADFAADLEAWRAECAVSRRDRRRSRTRRHRAAVGLVRGRRSALAGAPNDHRVRAALRARRPASRGGRWEGRRVRPASGRRHHLLVRVEGQQPDEPDRADDGHGNRRHERPVLHSSVLPRMNQPGGSLRTVGPELETHASAAGSSRTADEQALIDCHPDGVCVDYRSPHGPPASRSDVSAWTSLTGRADSRTVRVADGKPRSRRREP